MERADQVGRRTALLNVVQAEAGMGRVEGVGWRAEVLVGWGGKGLVVEGVRSEFRCVEMVSSMLVRERRRKSVGFG